MSEITPEEIPETPEIPEIPETPQVALSEVEEAAAEQGWSSEKGDLSALDFLKNGRVYRDRLSDDLKDMRKENERMYGIIAENITEQRQDRHEAQQKTVEQQIEEAAAEGNTDQVIELSKQLRDAPPPVQQTDPNVEYIQGWRKENAWYEDNPEMRDDAMGFFNVEMNKSGDPRQALPAVKARIEKLYPDHFKPKNPNQERGSGGETVNSAPKGGSKGLKRSDLSEDEAAHFDQFVDMKMDPEKLLASIQQQRIQSGR